MMMVNKNEDRERRYIINPESGLEIGMFRCSPEENIYSPTEIYMQNKQMYVFQSQPLVTEECMINPVCKSVPLDNLSNEAQQQAIYDDYIRRQGEQRLSEARQMALQYRQPAFMPNRNDAVNPVPNLAGNNNIQFPSDSRYAFMEGQLILRDNDTPEVLANFDIKPMIEVIQLLGEEQVSSKIKAVIIFEDHKSVFYIPSEDVKNVLTYARKADICCNVEYNPAKVAEKITHLFISRLNKIPKEFVQTQAGWVFKNGKVIFSHDARRNDGFKDIKFQTGVSILNKGVDNAQVINIFRRILSIGPINVMAPLIATALLGPLFRLFSEGSDECRPSFVTFINERSGSLKTAVAKVLYTMFNADNPKVPASFKDTATSMELRLKEARCAVALIDDYYATGISSVKCEMQRSLETIIRFVGDGISRNRSNANLEDVRGARTEGMVAITGEDTDGQLSTLLRCLVVNVDRGTFDGARLDEFQQDKLLWSTFLAVFIEYLEIKYVQIQSFITMNFSMVRQIYKDKFSDLRPVDQMVQLHLVYDILKEFLIALGGDGEEMNNHCLHCISGCFEAVKFSHEYAIENSAENQYPIVVYNLISKSEVHIAKTKDIYAVDAKSFDGFETEDYYVFDAERLYAKVLAYYRRLERRFPLTPSACKAALYKAGLLKVAYEKRGTDKEKLLYEIKYAFGNTRIRLLTIVKKSLADFMEDKL